MGYLFQWHPFLPDQGRGGGIQPVTMRVYVDHAHLLTEVGEYIRIILIIVGAAIAWGIIANSPIPNYMGF
jgi:hypothetical protein